MKILYSWIHCNVRLWLMDGIVVQRVQLRGYMYDTNNILGLINTLLYSILYQECEI